MPRMLRHVTFAATVPLLGLACAEGEEDTDLPAATQTDSGAASMTNASTSSSSGGSTAPSSSTTAETTDGPTTASTSGTTSTTTSTTLTSATTDGPQTGSSSDSTVGLPCGDGICALDEDADSCCDDCGVCDEPASVRMETGSRGGTTGTGVTPGGIADMHAYFGGGAVDHFEYAMTIVEPPIDNSSWFWALQFFFENTNQGGYTGLQGNGIIEGQTVGKMAIFSIWDSTQSMPGPGATCEMFGGEGVGQSCRLPFEWRENVTYRLELEQTSPMWWTLTLQDPTDGTGHEIGTIRTPDGWGLVDPFAAGFAEYYGQVDACDSMPHTVAVIHTPLADGQTPNSMDANTFGTCEPNGTSVCTGAICT